MNATTLSIATMQADHRNWLRAHTQWRHDNDRWQAEHESAVARLAEMQTIVREHGECLQEHARAFQQAEDAIAAHDRAIAEFQAGTSETPQDLLANRHQQQEGVFGQQKDAHERIRAHHEAMMAQLQALESSAAAAM
jgi:hypothetical protein